MRVRGDVSDTTCSGYTMSGNPGETIPFVFHDHLLHNYLNLEYYRGPLKSIHKLLSTYCLTQQQAMLENSVEWFRRCYSKDSLADIGILPKTESSQEKNMKIWMMLNT